VNIYVVVEGKVGERIVYKNWIPFVNQSLSYIENFQDYNENNFKIYSGGGYPAFFETIRAGIEESNMNPRIDRLVVAIDSEDLSYQEKYDEVSDFINEVGCNKDFKIIVQHFCLETWAIGNRKLSSKNITVHKLKDYKKFYCVYNNDPEGLPSYPKEELNRSQFCAKYLKKLLQNKYDHLTYTKGNPKILLNESFFNQVVKRLNQTSHIQSFSHFLNSFN
jgi:hypothetical protein